MKFALPRNWDVALKALKAGGADERRWPAYLFGGHLRTSTAALVIAFLALWWVHDTYRPSSTAPTQVPATQVVPPGYVPDPNYTWVPRSRLQQPPSTVTVTVTPTPTTTPATTTTPTTTPTTGSPPPPFGPLPPFVLPPPFGPPPPPPAAEAPPPPATSAPPAAPSAAAPPPTTTPAGPRQVTYSVTGTKAPFDIITVTYIDASGQRRTQRNVYIPWTLTLTPISQSEVGSVEASSLLRLSKLNCSITTSDGTVLSANNSDAPQTSC